MKISIRCSGASGIARQVMRRHRLLGEAAREAALAASITLKALTDERIEDAGSCPEVERPVFAGGGFAYQIGPHGLPGIKIVRC